MARIADFDARCSPKERWSICYKVFKQVNKEVLVNRVTTEEYGVSIVKRSHNSRLDKSKLIDNGFKPLPDWKDVLIRYLEKIKTDIYFQD